MTWLILILLSVVTYSISVILQKIILRGDKSDPVIFSIVFQVITGVLIGVYAVVTGQLVWNPIGDLWPNMLLMIALYGVGNVFIFKALQLVDASKFTILFATRGLFTIIGSSVLLGEALKNNQLLGAVLILVGIIIVNFTRGKLRLEKQDVYAFTAALLFGIANTNDRYLLGALNLYQFVTLSFVLSGLFVGILYYRKLHLVSYFLQSNIWRKMLALAAIYAVSAVLFFGALQLAPNSSQVAAINLTSTILIAILGITILHEKTHVLNKIVGTVISFIGLVLVSR